MFEIELPIESGGISYIDSNTMPIIPDMIICAKPGQVRHTKFPFKCYYIHMILHEGVLYNTLLNIPDFFETDKREIYQVLFSKIVKHYNSFAKDDEILLQSMILELIYTIIRDAKKPIKRDNPKNNNHLIIEKLLNHIREHLMEDLSLEKLAEIAHLSPIYLHNSFKAAGVCAGNIS